MEASFDRQELMASLAELEKRLGEYTPSPRLAAAPSTKLDVYLAAISTSVAAILIVIGSLFGSTGHLSGGRVLAALEAPPALQKFGPPPETTAQAPAAEQAAERAPATAETAAVAPPPPLAKALAAVEPPAPAVAPPTPEATIAKPANPAKKRKKPMAGQSEFRAFTSKFGKLAGGVTAALRHISTSLIPQ